MFYFMFVLTPIGNLGHWDLRAVNEKKSSHCRTGTSFQSDSRKSCMKMPFCQDTDTSAAELSATFGEQVGMNKGESCCPGFVEVVPLYSYCKPGKLEGSPAIYLCGICIVSAVVSVTVLQILVVRHVRTYPLHKDA